MKLAVCVCVRGGEAPRFEGEGLWIGETIQFGQQRDEEVEQ